MSAAEAAGGHVPELTISRRSLAMLGEPVVDQVPTIDAGVIPRAALRAELARGIGAFLGQVRAKPAIVRGRFAGWRVLALFPKRPEIHVQELRPGDTVLTVNGRSMERPEQFKAIWDSLSDASELLLETSRDARRRRLHYAISP